MVRTNLVRKPKIRCIGTMNTNLQVGQKVLTPDGEGTIEQINGEMVTVKLDNGQKVKVYYANQVEDNSNAG